MLSSAEARTVINTLRLADIECTAVDVGRTGLIGYGQAPVMGGIELYVATDALEAAKEAIGAAGLGANDTPGFYDATSGLSLCPEHQAPFDDPCDRCGTFICKKCVGSGERLCIACEQRLSAQRRQRPAVGAAKWVMRIVLLAFLLSLVLAFVANLAASARR